MIDFSATPMTYFIIGLTAVISFMAFGNSQLKDKLVFFPYGIAKNFGGEAYRFLTHGFIHADERHLIFNMLSFYFFAPEVEYYLTGHYGKPQGSVMFLLLYLSAIICASLLSFFRQNRNSYYSSLGASGAVSAIIFASILINPLGDIWGIWRFVFGPIYLLYMVYMDRRGKGKIAHDAHFMGAIYGLVAIVLLVPDTFANFIEKIISNF